MNETVFVVRGMTCGHCQAAVNRVLTLLTGVCRVAVDLPSGKVTVAYDPQVVTVAKMRESIVSAGYDVEA